MLDADYKSGNSEFKADVLIVGAGPAGASAAYYIATSGRKAIILDKQNFPRTKVCGDFVSPGSLRELQKMGITDPPTVIDGNVLNEASVFLNGQEMISGKFPTVSDMPRYGQVIPRAKLDSAILQSAVSKGAIFLEGFRVSNFTIENDGVKVAATDEKGISREFHVRLLIGADGNNSTVARILRGAGWPRTERAIVVRGYFENVAGAPNRADIYYADDSFPGYSWIFPFGEREANVGVGTVLGSSPAVGQPEKLLLKLVNGGAGDAPSA